MSDVAPLPRAAPRLEVLVIGAVCLAIVGLVLFGLSRGQPELRRSPAGLDGLQVWLASEGVAAQSFTGGWFIDPARVGLLVLPVFDDDLDQARRPPGTEEALLLQSSEYDLTLDSLLARARQVPSLVVLPKWRTGMRLTGLAHPVLLIDGAWPERLLRDLTGDAGARLGYAPEAFTPFVPARGDGQAEIYAAQVFAAEDCVPLIGAPDAMILGDCGLAGDGRKVRVWILSDPDLLNNHGLRLGDNARIARDLIGDRAGSGTVFIDYTAQNWLRPPRAVPDRERTWADLQRFFGGPFTVLWFGAAVLLAVTLWRGGVRDRPVRGEADAPGASKLMSVAARARLLRLSGQDGVLLGDYAAARLGAVARRLGAPAAGVERDRAHVLRTLERRDPARARALEAVLTRISQLPARLAAAEAIGHVDELELILEQFDDVT